MNRPLGAGGFEPGVPPAERRSILDLRRIIDALTGRVATNETDIAGIGVTTGWTPVVTQGVAVSITNLNSAYSIIGEWCVGYFSVGITSSGTAANQVRVSLPVAAVAAMNNIGMASIYDASTFVRYPGLMDMTSTSQVFLSDTTQASAAWALGTVTFTAALVSGDSITGSFRYKLT